MSWLTIACFLLLTLASFGGLTAVAASIDRFPVLHYRLRRSLTASGWITVALTFSVAVLYMVWLCDALALGGRSGLASDPMYYVPLLVLAVGVGWLAWVGISYRRTRQPRRIALNK